MKKATVRLSYPKLYVFYDEDNNPVSYKLEPSETSKDSIMNINAVDQLHRLGKVHLDKTSMYMSIKGQQVPLVKFNPK